MTAESFSGPYPTARRLPGAFSGISADYAPHNYRRPGRGTSSVTADPAWLNRSRSSPAPTPESTPSSRYSGQPISGGFPPHRHALSTLPVGRMAREASPTPRSPGTLGWVTSPRGGGSGAGKTSPPSQGGLRGRGRVSGAGMGPWLAPWPSGPERLDQSGRPVPGWSVRGLVRGDQRACPGGDQRAGPGGDQRAFPRGDQRACPGGDQRAGPRGDQRACPRGRSAGFSGEISGLVRGRTGGRGPGGDGYALRRESGRPEALTRVVASPRAGPFLPWVTSGAAGNGRARHP